MKIFIDQELFDICKKIENQNWDKDTWAGHEADDWFQTENYEGGYDADEMAFCFAKTTKKGEYWFQFTLEENHLVLEGKLKELESRLRETYLKINQNLIMADREKVLNYPEWSDSASDKELIKEFYRDLLIRYPHLKNEIEDNEGLLHVDMNCLRREVELLCSKRKIDKLEECFNWMNSLFCRSKNELLNAINVSFLEYFDYKKLSQKEFENVMPKELYRGYLEMMVYMETIAKEIKKRH